jgi:enoyl-[acyl-carrier-protein] reductase (NADH)
MTTPFDLTDQVAIITGSSRGIGRAIAETMAALGAKVVISSRRPEACEGVVAALRDRGNEAIAIPCNVSRKAEIEALVAGTLGHYGRIDIRFATPRSIRSSDRSPPYPTRRSIRSWAPMSKAMSGSPTW